MFAYPTNNTLMEYRERSPYAALWMNPQPLIRQAAVEQYGDELTEAQITNALRDPSTNVRCAVVRKCGSRFTERQVEMAMLDHERRVRLGAQRYCADSLTEEQIRRLDAWMVVFTNPVLVRLERVNP
jgi:hypothetical protein